MMFTDKASFDEMIRKYNILTVYYTNSDMLDYAYIDHSNAADIRYYLSAFRRQMVILHRISAVSSQSIRMMQLL